MKLFISHAGNNQVIAKALVEMLYAIGVPQDNMFCSCVAEIGIPIKEDIYDYLRSMLDDESVYVIYLLSDDYYRSVPCLNEMGAVWIKQIEYFTVLTPGFAIRSIQGAVNPNKIAIKLDDDIKMLKHRLGELKSDIIRNFSLPNMNETRWETVRDNFIKAIDTTPIINLNHSQGYCICDTAHSGCVIEDSDEKNLYAVINFEKTKSDICSIVVTPSEKNWYRWFAQDKKLKFNIQCSDSIERVYLELRVGGNDYKKKIKQVGLNEFILKDFTADAIKWQDVCEIHFLVERQNTNTKGNIHICDLCIVS